MERTCANTCNHVLCFRSRIRCNVHHIARNVGDEENFTRNEIATTKIPLPDRQPAAAGVVNNTIVPRKLKTMDRRLHWLRCREAQGQFQYYWASGKLNWGDYSTKHHPPLYLESRRMQFSGNSTSVKGIKSQ